MKKNKERIKKFLESLKKVPIVIKACSECGLSRNTIYRWKKEDEKFREKVDKAMEMGENSMDEVAYSRYYSLINKEHWPAIRHRLTHSPTRHEKTIVEQIDAETMKLRAILNKWRDSNIEKRKAEEQSKKA